MTLDELQRELERMRESAQFLQHKRLRVGRERLQHKMNDIELEIAARATPPKNPFSS